MIVQTRGGASVEMRTANLAAFGIGQAGWSGLSTAPAITVTPTSAGGIPAVQQAVRIAATAVASLDVGVYRGQGLDKSRVSATWQARLFAGQPNDQQTRFEFWETVEESISFRGNAFIWMNTDPRTGRVTEWYALHPDQVKPILMNGKRRYWVRVNWTYVDPVGNGFGFYDVDESTILHIKGFGDGGAWMAPSPIELHRLPIAAAGAKIGHENSTYGKGASVRGVISFPAGVSLTQLAAVKETWQATYEGVGNAGKTGVIGGGGVFTPVGLSMADAQFVESEQFDVEQIARIFNVPASMIGGGSTSGGRAQAPMTPEHEAQRWHTYSLGPRLFRIEAALNAYPSLFPSTSTYAWFDTTRLVRGDAETEAAIAATKVQTGQWLVDEARALDGLPPLPDGAGKVPQIVPVGGGANPVDTGTPQPPTLTPEAA